MQKKVTNSKHNTKKASQRRDASRSDKNKSIFNYDLEVDNEKKQRKKNKNIQKINANEDKYIGAKEIPAINRKKRKKTNADEDKYIGTTEIPKINKKKLEKIKRKKRRESAKRKRAIKKQEEIEEKQRNQRKKKMTGITAQQAIKLKRRIKIMGLVILVIAAITLFLLSPIFNLREIHVVGNNKISKEKIISLSKIQNGTNLFKISKKEVKSNIKEEPYIRKATVKRVLPSNIEITVEERILEYLFEFAGSYAYIGSDAHILEISGEKIEDKLRVKGYATSEEMMKPGNRLCKEDIDSLNDVIEIMESAKNNALDNYIKLIDISNKSDYILYIESEKKTVHLGDTSNLDTKMPYIKVIMEREKDIEGEIFVNVDLRNKYPYFSEDVYKGE